MRVNSKLDPLNAVSLDGLFRSLRENHPDQDVITWSWTQGCDGEHVNVRIWFTPKSNHGGKP